MHKTKSYVDFAAVSLIAPLVIVASPKYKSKEELDLKKYYAWRKPLEAIGIVITALIFQTVFNRQFGVRSVIGELPKYLNTRAVFDTKKLANVEDLVKHLGKPNLSQEVQVKFKEMYKVSQNVLETRQKFSSKYNFLQKALGEKAHPFRDENEIEEAVTAITKSGELTKILSKKATRELARIAQEAKKLLNQAIKLEKLFTQDLRYMVKNNLIQPKTVDKMEPFLIVNRPDQMFDYQEVIRQFFLIAAIPFNTIAINLLFPPLVKKLNPKLDNSMRQGGQK